MNRYLDIAPEVKEALDAGKPVVALESTIISHGMPYPQNVETALKVESIIREAGAVPATIAIIGGRLKAGLTREEIDYLGKTGAGIPKASRRDLPVLVAQGRDGACTVTTTMMIADMAGIRVFATGGIGGVHRGAQETFDISADLEELANTPVMVICAGAKSILDLGLTLEYLETHGVTVIGYGTDELPAFYTRKSGFGVDYELDTPAELAKAFHVKRELGLRGGLLVTNPIPEEYSMDKAVIDKAIAEAVEDAKKDGIHGKATTPYLLAKIKDLTGGDSLGTLTQNTELGIYGTLKTLHSGQTVEVLDRAAVHTGPVQIAATIDENGVQLFDAEIERVSTDARQETKTLVVRVTDPDLLAETGGIVQGMSGCPILQDGKLAGAVTHVFVDDPTRGYGIFAETMLEQAG